MRRHLLLLLAACASLRPAGAQEAPPQRLIREVGARSEAMRNLEAVCDGIGPRLTGSRNLRRAQAWALDKLRAYGAVNVHEEAYDLGRPWRRGVARGRLLNANGQALSLVQKAWTEGTRGVVRGDVVLLDVKTLAEFRAAAPGLKGRVVLLRSGPQPEGEEEKDLPGYRARVAEVWRQARCALVLLPSGKDYGLHEMGGGPEAPLRGPSAFLAPEDAKLLERLLARGVTPRVEAELGGDFGPKPVEAFNLVADLPGSERPDEMVIVGAHLDSWDLGTGATDNGAGCAMALEVLRAFRASGLRPKRTLRVVLFSGEEQGLLGSRAYVRAHAAELPKIQAVLVPDSGAGRVTGFGDMEVEAWDAPLARALAPAAELGAADVPYVLIGGSDQAPFFERGVPAFSAVQEMGDYHSRTHHSQADTVDHVDGAALVQGAQVMAVAAWGLLNAERLPARPPARE